MQYACIQKGCLIRRNEYILLPATDPSQKQLWLHMWSLPLILKASVLFMVYQYWKILSNGYRSFCDSALSYEADLVALCSACKVIKQMLCTLVLPELTVIIN
jgi:hypothetical protein